MKCALVNGRLFIGVNLRAIIRSIVLESTEDIGFETENIAVYAGQSNFTMYLTRAGRKLAYMDFVIFQGEPSISMIEVYRDEDKRKGYGRMLVDKLAEKYGYENIDWGMTTPDGTALQRSMDAARGFDRAEHNNKHYKKEEMVALIKARSIDAAKFFLDMTELGDKATWDKWGEYLKARKYPSEIDGIDLNDLDALSEWTRDSVNNKNPTEYEPDDWVMQFVEQLSLQNT